MKRRREQVHSPSTAPQGDGGTGLPLPNAEAVKLLLDASFRQEAARRFEVDPLRAGTARFGKSAIFYAALDGLAHNIALGGTPSVSFTYGEWATIGNTWLGGKREKTTTADGAGQAFREWALEPTYLPKSGPLRVRLVFNPSSHGGRNTPGLASVTTYFHDTEGRGLRLERRDDTNDYARVYLLGHDDVLETQAEALLRYARSKRLTRLFSWPFETTANADYRVDLLTRAEIERRRSTRNHVLAGAFLLPILPMLFGGWYARERQTLKDLVRFPSRALLQQEPLCREGVPVVRVQIVLGAVAETIYLIRREATAGAQFETVRAFRLGQDFDVLVDLRADRQEPSMLIRKAIDYTDTDVLPGHAYIYNVTVRSVLGEEFPFLRNLTRVDVPTCP